MMEILVWKHKYGDYYYDASTPEALDKAALAILQNMVETGWLPGPEDPMKHIEYSGIDLELAELTDEQVDALPTQSLKDEANKNRKAFANRRAHYDDSIARWQELQDTLAGKTVMSPDWVRRTDSRDGEHKAGDLMPGKPVTPWQILQGYSGGEYMEFETHRVTTFGDDDE